MTDKEISGAAQSAKRLVAAREHARRMESSVKAKLDALVVSGGRGGHSTVARMMEISVQYLSDVRSGRRTLSDEFVKALAGLA